jgi:tetratricopeptide (TPR) repeat protein
MCVSIGTILGHDLLDILQATDRAPFWPWSTQTPHIGIQLLPERSLSEGMLFLFLFAAFALWRIRSGRSLGWLVGGRPRPSTASPVLSLGLVWSARAIILAIVLAAVATHAVRGRRERQANLAGQLLRQGRYAEALLAADAADHWPRVGKPGRIDLIRGETHEALGEAEVAERFFLRAYEEDPTNFWAVADLAEFYAARNAPAAERRRLVQPYADELRRRFSRHERLGDVLARVDRKLQAT